MNAALIVGALYLLSQKKTTATAPGGPGTYTPTLAPRAGSTQAKAQQSGKASGSSSAGGPFSSGADRGGSTSFDDPTFWFGDRQINQNFATGLLSGETLFDAGANAGLSPQASIDAALGTHLDANRPSVDDPTQSGSWADLTPLADTNFNSNFIGPTLDDPTSDFIGPTLDDPTSVDSTTDSSFIGPTLDDPSMLDQPTDAPPAPDDFSGDFTDF